FSFGGLKSAFINLVHNANQRGEKLIKEDLAASFQASVVEVLVKKTLKAAQLYQVKQVVLAGGVAANQGLRSAMQQAVAENLRQTDLIIPPLRLCGDNAAMIGGAAHVELARQHFADWALNADPSLEFQKNNKTILNKTYFSIVQQK